MRKRKRAKALGVFSLAKFTAVCSRLIAMDQPLDAGGRLALGAHVRAP
jgi:hypothetical protein